MIGYKFFGYKVDELDELVFNCSLLSFKRLGSFFLYSLDDDCECIWLEIRTKLRVGVEKLKLPLLLCLIYELL